MMNDREDVKRWDIQKVCIVHKYLDFNSYGSRLW